MRGMLTIALTLTLTLPPLATLAAEGVIYKWQDENGRVNYGQTPPEGVDTTIVETHSPSVDTEAARDDLQDRLKGFNRREEQRDEAAEAESIAAKNARVRRRNCETARGNLDGLTAHGQVSLKEGDSYRKLTEEERQRRIADAEANIERFCAEATASSE